MRSQKVGRAGRKSRRAIRFYILKYLTATGCPPLNLKSNANSKTSRLICKYTLNYIASKHIIYILKAL